MTNYSYTSRSGKCLVIIIENRPTNNENVLSVVKNYAANVVP